MMQQQLQYQKGFKVQAPGAENDSGFTLMEQHVS
jgi:hypothetical protein